MGSTPAPRGTYLIIAKELADRVRANPGTAELPSVHEVMAAYGVSRGLVLRAFHVLEHQGVAEPIPGDRWKVAWRGPETDQRPLAERIAAIIGEDGLEVGAAFYSEGKLSDRLGVSRPTVRKALAELEVSGVLKPGGQGKPRTIGRIPA